MPETHGSEGVSPWVARFKALVPAGGAVLDLACGAGRHALLFRTLGHPVTAVDRNADALAALADDPGIETIEADLEDGAAWPLGAQRFAGVVVTNYLHRPLLPAIVGAVAADGVLIYETFAAGNERFGRPRNPDFLLQPGELLDAVRGRLRVVAFEDGTVEAPRQAMVQRICAVGPEARCDLKLG
jgi:SAM-dependent methyltransferase